MTDDPFAKLDLPVADSPLKKDNSSDKELAKLKEELRAAAAKDEESKEVAKEIETSTAAKFSQVINNPVQENKLPSLRREEQLAAIRRIIQTSVGNREALKIMVEISKVLTE